jgi:hypothetical protein
MQRLHEDDLAGHLLRRVSWQHLDLPAIAVEDSVIPIAPGKQITRRRDDLLHAARESKEALDRIESEIGGNGRRHEDFSDKKICPALVCRS